MTDAKCMKTMTDIQEDTNRVLFLDGFYILINGILGLTWLVPTVSQVSFLRATWTKGHGRAEVSAVFDAPGMVNDLPTPPLVVTELRLFAFQDSVGDSCDQPPTYFFGIY